MEKTSEYINLRKVIHCLYCDKCGQEMSSTGQVYATYPARYVYTCKNCKITTSNTTYYPWSEIIGDLVENE